mmetsp:Transcript_24696/g.65853  ORF Transcript_24696/g.65853 Transcript_24696/m.65853 type:complete len:145 (+) Transcript_24696:36-470(+)
MERIDSYSPGSGPATLDKPLKRRAVLTKQQVIEIFQMGAEADHDSALKVGKQFGVNEKTIRDIWSGRSWKQHLKKHMVRKPERSVETKAVPAVCQRPIKVIEPDNYWHCDQSKSAINLGSIDDLLFSWEQGCVPTAYFQCCFDF